MTKHRPPRYQRRLRPISMLLIGISVIAAASPTPSLTGKVVGIADGDTLTLLVDKTQIRVRLDGIDTPERAQPFGQKAGRDFEPPYDLDRQVIRPFNRQTVEIQLADRELRQNSSPITRQRDTNAVPGS